MNASAAACADVAIDWAFAGPRVHGRLVDARDRDLYRALYTSPDVMAHIGPVMTVEQADRELARAMSHNQRPLERVCARYWCLTGMAASTPIGIGALVRESGNPTAMEVGIMLLPGHQRAGLGKEIFGQLVARAVSTRWPQPVLGLFARHARDNAHAGRLPESCGFVPVASAGPRLRWERALG